MIRLAIAIVSIFLLILANKKNANEKISKIAFPFFLLSWLIIGLACTFGMEGTGIYSGDGYGGDYVLKGMGIVAAVCSLWVMILYEGGLKKHPIIRVMLIIILTVIGCITIVTAKGFYMPSGIGTLLMYFIGIPLAAKTNNE